MAALLVSDVFGDFCLQEAVINTSVSYSINGRIHRDFYSEEEAEGIKNEFAEWTEIRPRIFEMIKGKNLPLSFRMTLSLKNDKMHALLHEKSPEGYSSAIKELCVNIRFEKGVAAMMTGTSYESFVMTKAEELIWDNAFMEFLTSKNIAFTKQQ